MKVRQTIWVAVAALGAMMAVAYADDRSISNGNKTESLETQTSEEAIRISAAGKELTENEDATRTLRDWRVENPMTAGITKGLTLGMFPGGKYTQGAVYASVYDPFGMSRSVYQQVATHGKTSHQVGQAMGYGFWAFTLGGVFYRLLHKLKVDVLEKSHASK